MRNFFFLFFLLPVVCYSQVNTQNLRTENLTDPIGVDMLQPRFSWQLASDQRNVLQTAYEIKVNTGKTAVWNSGRIQFGQSLFISYNGAALQPGKKYEWQVKVWDNAGNVSAWSTPAFFQTGLLNKSGWKAKWIEPGFTETSARPAPMFRKEFSTKKKVQSAVAYITSHGLYEAQLNGKRIGDAYLAPGWTSYRNRLQYQVYDVTKMLNEGTNAIGVTLANGWYRGYIGFSHNNNFYGKDIALLLQIDIQYSDGTSASVISDESWKSSTGSILSSEIYNGEKIDNRVEKQGWVLPGFNDADWSGVKIGDHSYDVLVATYNEPIKKHETFKPVKSFTTPAGEKVLDFGQNLVGWIKFTVNGKAGDQIIVSHAEVLDKKGNFYTANLRAAQEKDTFILKGGGEEFFEPHFTFHGFRYARIEGYPGEIPPENFIATALYSDMKPTGEFTSSNPLINQLQHNIQWGQRGNFLDVPTDCPQRDERLGWTGDAQAFSRTAAFNFGVYNFFSKWLKDLAADQVNGKVPHVIPDVLNNGKNVAGGSAGWADASTIIPWNMYLAYGDKKILEQQYGSMKAWVQYMTDSSRNYLWNKGSHFGDWLSYMTDNDLGGVSAITDKYLIAQCFYAHSVQLVINAAAVIDKKQDVTFYQDLLHKIKEAFVKEYVTGNGRLVSGTQTAYVLALNFDMLPEVMRPQAIERLVQNIRNYNNHLSTGFLGTPYICHVLSRFGRDDVAYTLLLQETFPSWLYPVKMGATTIWERWNGIRPDSSFEPASMNSFNHYAYGAIGDWMYRVAAGLDTDEDGPGYKKIKIQPHPGYQLTAAKATLNTLYGAASSGWKKENGKFELVVTIPPNTTATIFIPGKKAEDISESGSPLTMAKDLQVTGENGVYIVVKAGSGTYHFVSKQ